MNENFSQSFRLAGSLAGALFVLAGVQTRAADKGDAFPNLQCISFAVSSWFPSTK